MDQGRKIYLILTYSIVALISFYVATSQWIINGQLYKDYDLTLFTGEPVIEADISALIMMFNIDVRTVDFRFKDKLDSIVENNQYTRDKIDGTTEIVTLFKATLSNDKKWIKLKVADGEKIEDTTITVNFNGIYNDLPKSRFFIDRIKVNGENIEVYDFLSKEINSNKTNLILHIPLSFSNISKNIANNYGEKIIELIKFMLIVLLSTQILLYLIGFVWQPKEISEYFTNTNPDDEVLVVDSISRKYAIPLGFLGTVLSIWVALEIKQQNFTDFNSVLDIFKGGIFTTVLGLSTNIVCLLRSNRIKLTRVFGAKQNED